MANALERLEVIQGKYEADLDPLFEVGGAANAVAQAMEGPGMRSPTGIQAKTQFVQALARVGVQASFTYDIPSHTNDQERK